MRCTLCGEESKKKFCSKLCYCRWRYRNDPRFLRVCGDCGVQFRSSRTLEYYRCRSCLSKIVMSSRNQEGILNPAWRGGSRGWQSGKLGRDKNGLSWKVQRRLAWERDQYTCQDCGKHCLGWKPHVHHIKPYRLSFSHALGNLRCLCNRCHKREEARVKELWGGQDLGGGLGREKRVPCLGCGSVRRKKIKEGYCSFCSRNRFDIPKARELRFQGLGYEAIGVELGVSAAAVWKWLKN